MDKIVLKPLGNVYLLYHTCDIYVIFQCSVSCGAGQQQRDVNCVSEEDLAVMPNSLCEKISKPETLRKCNMQECKTNTGLYTALSLPVCMSGTVGDLKSRHTTLARTIIIFFCDNPVKNVSINSTVSINLTFSCCVPACADPACRKNTMSSRFCDKLKLLGRCSLRSVKRQCCVTCGR